MSSAAAIVLLLSVARVHEAKLYCFGDNGQDK